MYKGGEAFTLPAISNPRTVDFGPGAARGRGDRSRRGALVCGDILLRARPRGSAHAAGLHAKARP